MNELQCMEMESNEKYHEHGKIHLPAKAKR